MRGDRTPSSLAAKLIVHALVVVLVVMTPVMVYDQMNALYLSGHRQVDAFYFIGGVTYPLYAIYWLLKIRSLTFKVTLIHLVALVSLTLFISGLCDAWKLPTLQLVCPLALALTALPLALLARVTGKIQVAKAFLIGTAVSLPIAGAMSVLLAFGQGMSALGGMRW